MVCVAISGNTSKNKSDHRISPITKPARSQNTSGSRMVLLRWAGMQYTYVHIHMRLFVYAFMQYIHTLICVWKYMHILVYAHALVSAHVYTRVYMNM